MKHLLSFICFLHIVIFVFAQKKNAAFQLHIHKASSPINIDGSGNEPAWQEAETAKNFFMVLPMDTSYAQVKTEVKVTYDNRYFYLLAVCYKAVKGVNMVESLHRDFNFQKNDNFLLFIDPFEDGTTGFSFGANAAGAQWDGTMYQ
ncbi:MAG: hydrolase, partial [Bacteroidota bacterium]|nr:hydrolase [Bacteroidota bacterium]